METILVTGGAGYIGSHTCKALFKAGYLPVVYDNLSTGHAYSIKWGPFVQGDIGDATRLGNALETYKPKAVLHFAASALVIESLENPEKYYRNNLAGSLSLLETMRLHNVKNLIFSSTCATYGHPQFTPITEEHPQLPVSPYGRTKWMAEQMMNDFSNAYGMKTIFLRYFNAAGADFETEIGENHTPETHLVPSIILTALGLKPEIVVYGTSFPTRDGSAIRDYVHILDLANAHVLALQYLLEKQVNLALNLGTGHGSSVLEIVDAVQKHTGKKIPVRLEQHRPGEPGILTADNRKAKSILGWEPVHSQIPLIIETAWKWHQLLTENAPLLKAAIKK